MKFERKKQTKANCRAPSSNLFGEPAYEDYCGLPMPGYAWVWSCITQCVYPGFLSQNMFRFWVGFITAGSNRTHEFNFSGGFMGYSGKVDKIYCWRWTYWTLALREISLEKKFLDTKSLIVDTTWVSPFLATMYYPFLEIIKVVGEPNNAYEFPKRLHSRNLPEIHSSHAWFVVAWFAPLHTRWLK